MFVAAGLLAVGSLGAILAERFASPPKNHERSGFRKIGVIQKHGSDVKRKFFKAPKISEVESGDEVYQKDTIVVGPGSKANLTLPDYGNFELEPNSAVTAVLDFEKTAPANDVAEAGDLIQSKALPKRLRIKLLHGKIKFKTLERLPDDSLGAAAASEAADPLPQVTIEVADRTLVDLSNQSELSVEKHSEGSFKVSESLIPVMAEVYDKNAESPQLIEVAQDQMLSDVKAERSMASLDEPVEVPPANEEIKAPVVEAQPIAPLKENEPVKTERPIKTTTAKQSLTVVDNSKKAVSKTTEDEVAKEPSFKQSGTLIFLPSFLYSGISSTDLQNHSRAVFLSKLNPGARLIWGQSWSQAWDSFLELNYQKVTFEKFSNRTVENCSQSLSGFQIGIKRHIFDRLTLVGALGMNEDLFPRASTPSLLRLDLIPIYRTSLGFEYLLYSSDIFKIEGIFGAIFLFPRSVETYSAKQGYGGSGTIRLLQEINRSTNLVGSLYFSATSQNTSLITKTQSEVGVLLGVQVKFGQGM